MPCAPRPIPIDAGRNSFGGGISMVPLDASRMRGGGRRVRLCDEAPTAAPHVGDSTPGHSGTAAAGAAGFARAVVDVREKAPLRQKMRGTATINRHRGGAVSVAPRDSVCAGSLLQDARLRYDAAGPTGTGRAADQSVT